MMRIGGRAVADDLPEDGCAAGVRSIEGFQAENSGAFAQGESIAGGVERPAFCW